MSNKKYYWLKLKEDFFEDDTIAFIEEQENGKDYVIFYLKLVLKSLAREGHLIRYVGEMMMPYDVKALAKLTNTDFDTVRSAMDLFVKIGLVTKLDTGEIYMNQIEEMIGTETNKAALMRELRARRKENEALPGNNVTEVLPGVTESYTEIEIDIELEKELEKDIEKDTLSGNPTVLPYKEIIDYLNAAANKKYRHSTPKTKNLIQARYKENFDINDFKKVIDIKTKEWLKSDMERYLRPETLFGTKFESYLNQSESINNNYVGYDVNKDLLAERKAKREADIDSGDLPF